MPIWISQPAALQEHFATRPARIGLDTEFIRERTYWPQLALVQIAVGDEILLVDPLKPGMTQALAPILADTAILKIMHSASEDLVAFKHACQVVPKPLFDTQLAAALAGIGGGLGYQKLVEQLTGVTLAKGETRSDWLRRPLSPAQLEYAADDVRHLFAMHDALDGQLGLLGRREWLVEDAQRTIHNAEHEGLEPWPHLGMRSAQFLDRNAQRRLLRLLRWRDAYARDHDRPRSWILDNELAVAIARSNPADRDLLQAQLDAHPKAPRKLGDAVWTALSTALADEDQAPDASVGENRDKQRLRKLQDAVAARSAELGLPDGVLASRRWLEALLDHGDWPDALSGWRRTALEPGLTPLLAAQD
ncbi:MULTISPECIES: ribonuclease D [unclassified Lysobacter]|uniref:ribonuclease D n=1 Tax=unclassified Lysobacter TaxID=2635362 RepID=UPI0006F2B82F|nr:MULTISPECIES: ribonuclease D [unclassified Lysobacter]KQZ56003.1 ribonuclease D [Lysobacter sp. Root559]KRC31928.1 ribonuclease D [Lysobacter sp. Root76]KRD67393.1 ribonuclease D [Lysobacter sp. Root96]